jgi:hypothetical protein
MASCAGIDNVSIRNQRVMGCLCVRCGGLTEPVAKPAAGAVQRWVGKRLPLAGVLAVYEYFLTQLESIKFARLLG